MFSILVPGFNVFWGISWYLQDELTVLYRLNGLTGQDFVSDTKKFEFPTQYTIPQNMRKVIYLPIEENLERTHILAIVDENLKIHLYPNHEYAANMFKDFASTFYFTLGHTWNEENAFRGYRAVETKDGWLGDLVWDFKAPENERIVSVGKKNSYGNMHIFEKYIYAYQWAMFIDFSDYIVDRKSCIFGTNIGQPQRAL